MPELKLTLETVTPLFLGGADPRGQPELRPPAFRGAMRYWLRAALGGAIGDGELNALRKLESRVFGSTGGSSPVLLRLHGHLKAKSHPILPHKHGGARPAFEAGQTFELAMWQLPDNDDPDAWAVACAALGLMLTFGGVGLRSRRGCGSLRVVESSAPELMPLSPATGKGWVGQVFRVIDAAQAAAGSLADSERVPRAGPGNGPLPYPSFASGSAVLIGRRWKRDAQAQLTHFMENATGEPAFGGIRPRQSSPLWVRPVRVEHGYLSLYCLLASMFPAHDEQKVLSFLQDESLFQAQLLWPRRRKS